MNRFTRSSIFIVGFVLLFSNLKGQNLPQYDYKMLMNDTLSFELFSYLPAFEVAPFPVNGDLLYPTQGDGYDNHFPVSYIPDEGFTGVEEFIFQYRGNPGSGVFSWAVKYSKFRVEVLPSVVTIIPDNIVSDVDPGTLEINVLANDSSTHGDLNISEITDIIGGTASISPDNTILFDIESGFEGVAYLNYVATDPVGSNGLGQLSVQVKDMGNSQETVNVELATLNTKALSLLLPANDFSVDAGWTPVNGSLSFELDNQVSYTPLLDFVGQDTFMLKNGEQERFYFISIYDIINDGHAPIDDEIFTLENEEVIFNVHDNDHQDYYMHSWTQPSHGYVNHLGNGEFSYLPDEDYHGYDEFTYKMRVAPIVFQTATVRIGIGNFNPVVIEEFDLNTAKNYPVVIDYDVPVHDFEFEISNDPDNGILTYYPGDQTLFVGCDSISGYNLLIYQPDNDYTGIDDFEFEYCPGDADCKLVKVSVDVLNITLDPCPCVAKDCVWEGDTNGDGYVNVKDILPIGYFMGEEGDEREYDPEEWLGIPANDWTNVAGYGEKINLKHIDCDGNGLINAQDTSAVSDNYDKIHTVVANGVNAVKPFPLSISTNQDTVAAGDWLHLIISVGNESNPIIDFTGITYSLQFPPELIDSSSLKHEFFKDSWFDNASSSLQMNKQPLEGKVDAGFTRIGGIGTSGFGPIGKCDFIVEDEIDGFRLKSELVPLKIKLDAGQAMDQLGNIFDLPATEKTIYLDLREQKEAPKVKELILYPNPARDQITVHLNGENTIKSMNIFTSTGMLLERIELNNNTNQSKISIENYNSGVYFIEVETPRGKTAQRFEVIK